MAAMINIRALKKVFGPITAVDGVSFDVERGEVLGFLGPNGAGKSTTMRMVAGFLTPTSGTAIVCGHDVLKDPLAAKRAIGYLPEGAPAYPDMTPDSFLRFVGEVRGLTRTERRRRVDEVCELVHLEGVMRQPIETLSKGYKRRVGLAHVLLHDPDVLIMDEPTDGLDPNQKHEVRQLISHMADRKAIVLSTHILEEVDAVCTRAIVIAKGRIVADGTPEELQQRSRFHNAVTISVAAESDAVLRELTGLSGVSTVEMLDSGDRMTRCRAFTTNGVPIVDEVSQKLRSAGWDIAELHVETGHLDDVFRSLTVGDKQSAPAIAVAQPSTAEPVAAAAVHADNQDDGGAA